MVLIIAAFFLATVHAQQGGDGSPALIDLPKAVYPDEAKADGLGGRIWVRVTVGARGEVLSIEESIGLAKPCSIGYDDRRNAALRRSAVDAIREAKFSPATKDGKPVKASAWVHVEFDAPKTDPQDDIVKVDGYGVVRNAVNLPKPKYPAAARQYRASGAVSVLVVVNQNGEVITADAVSGHPMLRAAAVSAACSAKFHETVVDGKQVRVAGVITYNFIP